MEGKNMEHSHEEVKAALWEKSQQSEVIKRLKSGEGLQVIMDSLEKIQEAFTDLDVIVCSDGRVLPSDGAKLGIAGEGILLGEEDLKRLVENCKGKIKKVTSHEDCGAAGVAFRGDSKGKNKPDELGIEFAQILAEKLGAEYEHLPMSKMKNTIHNERFICFDGTGRFNPEALKEMPGQFVCSGYAFGLGEDYLEIEIATLAGIALGDHGFGKKFTKDNKFMIIVSAKDDAQLAEMTKIAEEAIEKYGELVEVRGFVHNEEA